MVQAAGTAIQLYTAVPSEEGQRVCWAICGEVGRVWQPLWEMWGDGELGARPHARNRARPGVSGPRNKCVQGGLGVPETLLVGSLVVHRAGGIELHGPVS